MTGKVERFMINVTIIEGRHLAWPNMDSAVHVRVDNQRKCTPICYNSDSPFFNEFFAFEFFTTLQTLIDKNITLTVIQPRKIWRAKRTLGYVTLDVATIWAQPDHQFYHKWAVIAAPLDDSTGGNRGYIKVDISILRRGESPIVPTDDLHDTDEIEGNLLLPEGVATGRQKASYIIKIYRGENLCKGKYLDSKSGPTPEKDPPNSYIEVFFAGLQAKTSIKKSTINPVWNESLVLTELFPPLCQRIKIHLCYTDSFYDTTFAVHHINLRSISNDGEHGFLPTFGPSFVHFYSKGSTNEGFVGKVLMSFTTDLLGSAFGSAKSVSVGQIPALAEANLWKDESVLLFGTIFDANCINKEHSDKPVSYEINFGNAELQTKTSDTSNRTAAIEPSTKEKLYWHLEYGKDKPCVFIRSLWPDFRKRFFNSNLIAKISQELKSRLGAIESLFLNEERISSERNINNLLVDAIDFLSSACRQYIDITQGGHAICETELDIERRKLCLREMEDIQRVLSVAYDSKIKNQWFTKMQTLRGRLDLLVEEAQDCWPDVYVTMLSGNKKVAFCKCPSRDIVYSVIDEEKGQHCGTIQNLFLLPNNPSKLQDLVSSIICTTHLKATCKLEIFLWLGLDRHKGACFEALPEGFFPPNYLPPESLPTYLVAQQEYYFQCRVHIYQGKFFPGSDKSGLCDPFARVIFGSDCRETTVSSATLNPVWDQTLVYRKLVLFGTKQHIKTHLPSIVAELFDQDDFNKTEFIGRCIFKPILKFVEDPYKAPNFPPKLQWHNINKGEETLGEILAVAELLEICDDVDDIDLKPLNEIIRIPTDIKPTMVKFRIDVIFWGVRELQRIYFLPITKPKITLECGYATLHSETILNVTKNLNFTQYTKQIDVTLPEQKEYAPPLCIKMFDCRSFGRYTLAGTRLVPIKRFLYYPLTAAERSHKMLPIDTTSWVSTKSTLETIPIISVDHNSTKVDFKLPPSSKSEVRESPYKLWIKSLFSPNKKPKKWKKTTKSDKASATDLDTPRKDIENQKCTCEHTLSKKEKRKINTSDESSTDPKIKKKSSNKNKKQKKLKETSTSEDNLSGGNSEVKLLYKSKSPDKKNKRKKREKSTTTTSDSTSQSETKRCCIHRSRSNKKKQRKRRTKSTTTNEDTTDSSSNKSKKSQSKFKSTKKRKKHKKGKKNKSTDEDTTDQKRESCCKRWMKCICRPKKKRKKRKDTDEDLEKDVDWWTKFYASIEEDHTKKSNHSYKKKSCTLKIYLTELELQPEFEAFADTLQTFQMYKGKRTGDETIDEGNIKGIFKGAIKIYRWPPPDNFDYVNQYGMSLEEGAFQNFPINEQVGFVVRIYCVKGINLRPKDASGKSDPYISITMGTKTINDRINYIPKQVNPIFGRCYELFGGFPHDHAIIVSVWDWDTSSSDDLIGETKIDIENRFYSNHRGHCGIAAEYQQIGHCSWRDSETPSQILEQLCRRNNITSPVYSKSCVRIGFTEFSTSNLLAKKGTEQTLIDKEAQALSVLHRWREIPLVGCPLVPEHVETRSLYHPAKPGIEQGKLQLWIDIFHCTDLPPPRQVNITPRKPVAYELRVIIWNTDDVILEEDDFFVGEKMSDIYVKGWLTGPNESQCTDVHYRSMTGEGSFNWRFVFPFKYLITENKLIQSKKESIFSIDETEVKLPCRLTLQVWDNDTFSADDFLGVVSLELSHLPRGARTSKACNLDNLSRHAPTINLFRTKRTKGWWPFRGTDEEKKAEILGGKVEVEFELVTAEEAEKNPVGFGRAAPQPLPMPHRPDTSFSWFKNPLKAVKFLLCKHYRWRIIKFFIFICLFLGIALAVYSIPGYSVKKLLGV